MLPMPNPKALFFPHQLLSPRLSPQSPDLWVSVALTSLLLTHLTYASPPMFSAFLFGGRERCRAEHNLRAHGFFPHIRTCLHFWGAKQPKPALALIADCREEQYPCTRLYSVHKPCKQCLNEICFYRQAQGLPLSPLPPSPLAQRRIWVVCFFF